MGVVMPEPNGILWSEKLKPVDIKTLPYPGFPTTAI